MGNDTNVVNCPRCGTKINVSEILYNQVQETLKKDFEAQNAQKDLDYMNKIKVFQNEKEQFNKDKETVQQQIDNAVKEKLNTQKTILEKTIRLQIEEEKSGQVKSLEEELKLKSEQVKELNNTRADNSRLRREKDELRGTIEAEEAEKFNKQLIQEKEKIKSAELEKSKTELQKRDKLIDDLNNRLADAQTKLEQGSNKLSGEVKEIELRDFLKATFPIDEIKDVPSGITGADVFHVVRNNVGQPSGIILYERKQTQTFGREWVSKLKEDGRRVKADICVIVTRAMPKENSETHFKNSLSEMLTYFKLKKV